MQNIKELFSGASFINLVDNKTRDYLEKSLYAMAVERTVLEITKELEEEKFANFIGFLRKGASRDAMIVYLSGLHPKCEDIIIKNLKEIIKEFETEYN